jgi:hypothetical protein
VDTPPFIDTFPIKTFIYRGCSISMFDYQRAMGSSWGWNQHIAGWMATRGKM